MRICLLIDYLIDWFRYMKYYYFNVVVSYSGTVIGAFITFALFYALDCPSPTYCTNAYIMPVIVVLVFIGSFFREGPRHGYAILVTVLTPIVLLLGMFSISKVH